MIITTGQGHHLRQAEATDGILGHSCTGRREVNRTNSKDGALPRHQSRYRHAGPEHSRVGDGNRCTLEVCKSQFSSTRTAHDIIEGRLELTEVEWTAIPKIGYYQRSDTPALHIHSNPKPGHRPGDPLRFTVHPLESMIHLRMNSQSLDQCPCNEMCE